MLKNLKSKLMGVAGVVGAFAISLVPHAYTFAAQTYDFSSSTAESAALVTPLRNAGFTIAFGAVAALIVLAVALIGAGWVWGRFKKFSGMGKKI